MLTTALAKFLVWLLERRSCTNCSETQTHRWRKRRSHRCNTNATVGSSTVQAFAPSDFKLTMSLSLTTISSIYLVSLWTEGLRTKRLDRRSPPDACCSRARPGLPSLAPRPLRSHPLSSVQSGHTQKQSCSQLQLYDVFQVIVTVPMNQFNSMNE